ncbi:MAG: hypothetical protein C4558_09060 [Dehalococcoidia bacterium]|nr:MAG: hypothetical protein C4558_09060 [Dehalococcoidia bacterium]
MYDLDAIRTAHPIVETVCDAGVELRRSGRRFAGRCPFHADGAPSLMVYPETGSYFCFGCNTGGDVIDFVGRLRRTGFKETVEYLSQHGLELDHLPTNVTRLPSRTVFPALTAEELATVDAAATYYAGMLNRYTDVRAYLADRGVGSDLARRLRLGYGGRGLAAHLRSRGLPLDPARRIGLLDGEREPFTGRVVIPDLDAGGHARWLTGRTLGSGSPRYLNLRAPAPLLGLRRAQLRGDRAVIVTEGPFDWLTGCGWELSAVALLGTHASRDALAALHGFRRVYLALDADGPGRHAARALASDLGERATIVDLPRGIHDLNELGQRRDGRTAFLRSLHASHARMEETWSSTTHSNPRARAA